MPWPIGGTVRVVTAGVLIAMMACVPPIAGHVDTAAKGKTIIDHNDLLMVGSPGRVMAVQLHLYALVRHPFDGGKEVAGALTLPGLLLYAGTIFWVVGYDTIYALQDREDDALIGIGSSALSMGRHVRGGVTLCYLVALSLWAAALWQVRPQWLAFAALLPMAVHLFWQVGTLKEDGADPLTKFRSNRFAGLLMFLACLVVGSA